MRLIFIGRRLSFPCREQFYIRKEDRNHLSAPALAPAGWSVFEEKSRPVISSVGCKMSWLFGKKEHPKHPLPDPIEEDISMDQCEGYEFVRKRPAPPPPTAAQDATVYPGGNLYPYVPSVPDYSNASSTYLSKDHGQEDAAHYLSGVPFKLCKQLEISTNNDPETDRLRIDEILSFVDRIDSRSYDYSFSVEESVIAEMDSRSNE